MIDRGGSKHVDGTVTTRATHEVACHGRFLTLVLESTAPISFLCAREGKKRRCQNLDFLERDFTFFCFFLFFVVVVAPTSNLDGRRKKDSDTWDNLHFGFMHLLRLFFVEFILCWGGLSVLFSACKTFSTGWAAFVVLLTYYCVGTCSIARLTVIIGVAR